ncbi:MAG: AAA family ATPase [Dehalococcoidia bacterium]|nr:AAA family ATPase [Dehalococcoidia bacterium]
MPEKLSLSVENIGGLYGTRRFEFKPGLNLVTAPNAAGKSSIIHALQALVLDERDLTTRDYFLHSFESMGRVELNMKGHDYVRRLKARDGGLSVGGEPLYPEGRKVNLFCIAAEDNELMDRVKTGKALRSTLLDFSDHRYYELLGDFFEQQRLKSESQLRQYRDRQAELELLTGQLRKIEAELEQLENERRTMEEIPLEIVVKTEEERRRLAQAQKELSDVIAEITAAEGEINRTKNRLEDLRNQELRLQHRVGEFESQHPDIEQELASMDRELESFKNKLDLFRSEMDGVQAKFQDTSHNWTRHVKYGIDECFACGTPIKAEQLRDRQKQLEQRSSELSNEINSLQWRIEEQKKERTQLQQEWTEVRSQIRADLNNRRRAIDMQEDSLKKLEVKRDSLLPRRPELSELVKQLEATFDKDTREKLERRRQLDEKIARRDQDRKTKIASIEQIGDVRTQIVQFREEIRFCQELNHLVSEKAEEVKRAVRNMFNERITEVYRLLEFDKDFERIYLDDGFQLKIIRRFGDQRKDGSINTLSRGEKETVALVLMLAGREAYLPDFPLFIADETTFYDSTRFRRIVEYVSKRVPYTIIANLVPKDKQDALTIEYELAKV